MNEITKQKYSRLPRKAAYRLISFFRWFFTSRGLIVLLLSGSMVNLTANYAEDMVKRQRYLELLQYEITWHISFASRLSKENSENNYSDFNKHFIPSKFYQSALNSGYLISTDPVLFLEITTYYELVNLANQRLERQYEHYDQLNKNWVICEYSATTSASLISCDEHKKILDKAQMFISEREKTIWNGTIRWIYESQIDKKFHPTQDRLTSPILRLLMGSNSIADEYLK